MITIKRISAKIILSLSYSVYWTVKEHRMYVNILMSKIRYFKLFLMKLYSLFNGKNAPEKLVEIRVFSAFPDLNTTNTTINPAIMAPTTVVSLVSTTPTSVSTIVNKVVEHLGREPSSPVATVCIYYFCETLNRVYYGTAQYTVYSILQNRILYTLPYSI